MGTLSTTNFTITKQKQWTNEAVRGCLDGIKADQVKTCREFQVKRKYLWSDNEATGTMVSAKIFIRNMLSLPKIMRCEVDCL